MGRPVYLLLNSLQRIAAARETFKDSGLVLRAKSGMARLQVASCRKRVVKPFDSFPNRIIPFLVSGVSYTELPLSVVA